jgi:hypothetical protein
MGANQKNVRRAREGEEGGEGKHDGDAGGPETGTAVATYALNLATSDRGTPINLSRPGSISRI